MRYAVYYVIAGIQRGKLFYSEDLAISYRDMHEELGRTTWIEEL